MRRPRPIRRLVDGRPDDSGRTISRRLTLLMTPAISLANAVGATIVLFVAVYVVPLPDIGDQSAALVANFIAFGVFLGVAVFVGVVWGYQRLSPVRAWLRADRAPSEDEQRLTLRAPRRILLVNGFLWALAVVVFTAVNFAFSAGLALVVAIVIVLGGTTTSAVAYLIAERLLRPVVARALRERPPQKPLTAGIVTRSLAAWALGTGVPVFGLVLVAIASLADFDVNETQLAITALCLGGVSLAVGLLMTYQAARGIADPVVSTREALNRVEEGDFEAEVPVFDGSELGLMQSGFNRMAGGPARARGDPRAVRPPGGLGRGQGGDGAGHGDGRRDARGGRAVHRHRGLDQPGPGPPAARGGGHAQRVLRRGGGGGRGARRLDQQVRGRRGPGGVRRADPAGRRRRPRAGRRTRRWPSGWPRTCPTSRPASACPAAPRWPATWAPSSGSSTR